jgi:hypothetical protein
MFTRLVVLLRVKDSNLDRGVQSAASFRLNEPGSPYDVVRLRTARGNRTLITAGLSRGPLPVGLERHANCPGGRGRTCTATPHQSASSPLGYPWRATDENPLAEVAAAGSRLPLPGGWQCPEGGGREVAPSLRIVRAAVPPRGLEPRSPRYEGGVLPVELRWQEVRREPRAEEGTCCSAS